MCFQNLILCKGFKQTFNELNEISFRVMKKKKEKQLNLTFK